jgi:photosystem I P700 chlorophyll a apoprotein A2
MDSRKLFHVAWQGNFEKWVSNPLKVKPIAHSIWDPHFGESAIKAFSKGNTYPVNIAYSGVYQWWYTIGFRTNQELYQVQLVYYYYHQLYYLLVGYIYNQNSVQVYLGLKIMNHV